MSRLSGTRFFLVVRAKDVVLIAMSGI